MLDPAEEAQLIFEQLRNLYREAREGELDPDLARILIGILDSQIAVLELLYEARGEETTKEPQRKENDAT